MRFSYVRLWSGELWAGGRLEEQVADSEQGQRQRRRRRQRQEEEGQTPLSRHIRTHSSSSPRRCAWGARELRVRGVRGLGGRGVEE